MPGLAPRAALLLVCLLPSVAAAQDRTLSPFFQIDGGDPGIDRLPLLGTDVTVNISGVIAEVTVRQRYRNDGTRPIHARYVFPASTRAAVHGLSLVVGRDVIRARIRERSRARQEFEAARRDGRNAALLEEQRPNVFTMEVANVQPGQPIAVELRYTELLAPAGGTYEFVYPTVVGPRYANGSPGDDHDRWLRTPYTHASRPPAATFALAGTLSAGLAVESL